LSAKRDNAGIADAMAKYLGLNKEAETAGEEVSGAKPSKRGTMLVTQHDPAVIKQLKLLAAERNTTQQKLVAEGLNIVFQKYGKQPIAS
jgi:hypothetical protein